MSLEAMQLQTHQQKAATPTPARGILQRKCACGNHTMAGGECAECRKKRLQRKATNHTELETVPPIVHEVLRSPGQPLDPTTRAFMEPRFGHDFSQVRVHTGAKAAESSRSVNALAYTVGRDMVFGSSQYTPTSEAGQRLIAHELTHVVQQDKSGSHQLQSEWRVNHPGDAWEQEADEFARQIVSRPHVNQQFHPNMGITLPALQRSCSDGQCESCLGGRRDFWVTVFFRRRATQATMTRLRTEINEAKRILANCCLDLKFDFNWTLLRGPSVFPAPTARPAGDPLGPLDYPADAEALGEGPTFAGARGVPMLVVDDVPGSGGGVTMLPGLDAEYTGRNYFAIAVNQPNPNPNCNHIAHELWHMTGAARHDPAEGAITACTSNAVSDTYCRALRAMVAPIGDFPTPRNRDTAVA